MSRVWGLWFTLLSGCLITVCGCGSTSTTVLPVARVSGATLAGNWLLYGSLPSSQLTTLPGPPDLTVSFDVAGSTITGSAVGNARCPSGGSFGFGFSGLLTGNVNTDGTFTIAPRVNSVIELPVTGTVPKAAGGAWAGTYTIVNSGTPPAIGTVCTINDSGSFTATSIGDVTGTYTGTGTAIGPGLSSTGSPVAVTAVLQQGALIYSANPSATPVLSRLGLSGGLQVQGFPCFTHGVTSTSTTSEVGGSMVSVVFVMDDGSTLRTEADILETSSTNLSVHLFDVRGGSCNGTYGFKPQPLIIHR